MRRFVYVPECQAYIRSEEAGVVYDVSEDIIRCEVVRNLDALSTASITLQNKFSKWTRKFQPMDRMVVYMARVGTPVLEFSGYVDDAPFFQIAPEPVVVNGSCTLKLLQNTYFDPGLPFLMQYFNAYGWKYDPSNGMLIDPNKALGNLDTGGTLGTGKNDGSIARIIAAVIRDIGGWPGDHIRIRKIPKKFLQDVLVLLREALDEEAEEEKAALARLHRIFGVEDLSGPDAGAGALPDAPRTQREVVYTITQAWERRGMTGDIGVATALNESGLNPDARQQGGDYAMGLFQTFPDGAGGGRSHADEVRQAFAHKAEPVTRYYASGHQIQDASEWFGAYRESHYGGTDWSSATDAQKALFAKQAQGAGDPLYETKIIALLPKARQLVSQFGSDPGSLNPTGSKATSSDIKNPYPKGTENYYQWQAGFDGLDPGDDIPLSERRSSGGRAGGRAFQRGKRARSTETDGVNEDSTRSGTGTFMFPVATGSGVQFPPQGGQVYNDYPHGSPPHHHAGVDIPAPEGTPLVACVDGVVASVAFQGGGDAAGNYVTLAADRSDATFNYFHMHDIGVHQGQHVKMGDVIGHVGHTGTSSGFNHCHFEFHPSGKGSAGNQFGFETSADPTPMLKRAWNSGRKTTTIDAGGAAGGAGSSGSGGTGGSGGTPTSDQIGDIAKQAAFFTLTLGGSDTATSVLLRGKRALANDVPLFEWVQKMVQASGRRMCSLPNGDFMAFFPDEFGNFGRTPYLTVQPIEITNFTIQVSDKDLVTHVFGTGSMTGMEQVAPYIGAIQDGSSAVASVLEKGFDFFINRGDIQQDKGGKKNRKSKRQDKKRPKRFSPVNFLRRFGARPRTADFPEIRHPALIWMATWREFLKYWSSQFVCQAGFTFMPEMFPGGLVGFVIRPGQPPAIQMFVEQVTHTFDRQAGATTTAVLTSPAATKSGDPRFGGMVLANGFGSAAERAKDKDIATGEGGGAPPAPPPVVLIRPDPTPGTTRGD